MLNVYQKVQDYQVEVSHQFGIKYNLHVDLLRSPQDTFVVKYKIHRAFKAGVDNMPLWSEVADKQLEADDYVNAMLQVNKVHWEFFNEYHIDNILKNFPRG